jgi:hypothetical protein
MESPKPPPLPLEANFNKMTNLYRIEHAIKHKRNKYSLYDNKWKIILDEINNLINLLKYKIIASNNTANYTNNFKNIVAKIKEELNKSKSMSSSLTNLFLDSKKKEEKKLITNKLKEMITNINANNKDRFNKSYLNNINKNELELKQNFIKSLLTHINDDVKLYRSKSIILENLFNKNNQQQGYPIMLREILEEILNHIQYLKKNINIFDLNQINQLSKQIIELKITLNKIYKNVEDLIKILSSDFKNNHDKIKQIKQIIQNNIKLQEYIINMIME